MKKHKEAYASPFNIPIFMAANQMIKCWHDNAGSLKRRIVGILFVLFLCCSYVLSVFPCRYHVPPNKIDPNLMEKLVKFSKMILFKTNKMQQFSLWIQKINKCYRACTAEFSEKDIWSVLPKYLQEASEETMRTVNALQHFFTEPNIVFGDGIYFLFLNDLYLFELFISESEFRNEFKKFCDKNGYDKKDTKWEYHYYHPVFETKGLSMKRDTIKSNFKTQFFCI